jgi:uncharacterized protein YdaU (DUF1376 family)
MKSYKHNIEKFNKATSGLSATDTMIYLRLLWKLYEDEQPLKDDLYSLCKVCNTEDEKSVNWVVEHFFEREDVGVTHPYVRRQLNQSQAMRNRMRGVSQASWEVLTEDGEKFWKSLPDEKKYKHKKNKELLIIPFRRNKSKIEVDGLIDYCKSYFKFHEDGDYWKSPKKLVEEYLLSPNYRFGRATVNNYTKGVK